MMDTKTHWNRLWWWCMAMALVLRLWLCFSYYGWEESDYGNLAMVHGVWQSGFTDFDMNHMPGYYFLSAVVYSVIRDSVIASKLVSFVGGAVSLLLASLIVKKIYNIRASVLFLALVLIEPELTLYSASSLREPVYTAFLLLALWGILHKRSWLFMLAGACAFLVRFEAPLFLGLIGWVYVPKVKDKWLFVFSMVAVVFGWSLYCYLHFDTWTFWSHAASVNVQTGQGGSEDSVGLWLQQGCSVVWGLCTTMMPSRMGWVVLLLALYAGVPILRNKQWNSDVLLVWVWMILMLGVWLGIAAVAQHEVGHNLYWKWFYPLVPYIAMAGVGELWKLILFLQQRYLRIIFIATVLLYTWYTQYIELHRQFVLSKKILGPQVELAKWMESNIPESEPMIVDNIPACWLRRKENSYTLYSWFDLPKFSTPQEMYDWTEVHQVRWILFFQEEWTQAPLKAPFLQPQGKKIMADGAQFVLVDQEAQYGWAWYHTEPFSP